MAKKTPAKTKDRASTEGRLLDSAQKIFSKIGYQAATTRMIAQDAGINLSLINRYFDGKYGLLIALVKRSSEEFFKTELNYPPQKDIQSELVEYGKFILSRHLDSICLIKVCFVQYLSDPKFLKKFRDLIMEMQTNPEILKRLSELAPQSKVDFEKILDEIEIHGIGLILTAYLLEDQTKNELFQRYEEFILAYSKHLLD